MSETESEKSTIPTGGQLLRTPQVPNARAPQFFHGVGSPKTPGNLFGPPRTSLGFTVPRTASDEAEEMAAIRREGETAAAVPLPASEVHAPSWRSSDTIEYATPEPTNAQLPRVVHYALHETNFNTQAEVDEYNRLIAAYRRQLGIDDEPRPAYRVTKRVYDTSSDVRRLYKRLDSLFRNVARSPGSSELYYLTDAEAHHSINELIHMIWEDEDIRERPGVHIDQMPWMNVPVHVENATTWEELQTLSAGWRFQLENWLALVFCTQDELDAQDVERNAGDLPRKSRREQARDAAKLAQQATPTPPSKKTAPAENRNHVDLLNTPIAAKDPIAASADANRRRFFGPDDSNAFHAAPPPVVDHQVNRERVRPRYSTTAADLITTAQDERILGNQHASMPIPSFRPHATPFATSKPMDSSTPRRAGFSGIPEGGGDPSDDSDDESSIPPDRQPRENADGEHGRLPGRAPRDNGRGMGPGRDRDRDDDGYSWDAFDDRGRPVHYSGVRKEVKIDYPHFDGKYKLENIPEWNGDTDKILDWLEETDQIARESDLLNRQLGKLVPRRFKGAAKEWWLSLAINQRDLATASWSHLKLEVMQYWMGRSWTDRQRLRARDAKYRDRDAPNEKPSAYFIRKYKLLRSCEAHTESTMIMAIMEGAPAFWNSIIDTQLVHTTSELQRKIVYHEDALTTGPSRGDNAELKELRSEFRQLKRDLEFSRRGSRWSSGRGREDAVQARAHKAETSPRKDKRDPPGTVVQAMIGFSKDLPPPPFPRDDKTKSKGKSPGEKGARPCRHCGSPEHWDNECKHAKTGAKIAKAHFAEPSTEYQEAQDAYEEAYYDETSESESESGNDDDSRSGN